MVVTAGPSNHTARSQCSDSVPGVSMVFIGHGFTGKDRLYWHATCYKYGATNVQRSHLNFLIVTELLLTFYC